MKLILFLMFMLNCINLFAMNAPKSKVLPKEVITTEEKHKEYEQGQISKEPESQISSAKPSEKLSHETDITEKSKPDVESEHKQNVTQKIIEESGMGPKPPASTTPPQFVKPAFGEPFSQFTSQLGKSEPESSQLTEKIQKLEEQETESGKFEKSINKAKEFYKKNKTTITVVKTGLEVIGTGISLIVAGVKLLPMLTGSKKSDLAAADTGILASSPYPEAAPDDENYKKKLLIIANKFNNIQEKFTQALERNDYDSKNFTIPVGTANLIPSTVEIKIEYDFKQNGAGNIEMPFTPFTIKFLPNQIDGFAVDTESLILQISSEDTRNFANKLIYPDAAFIFLIKYILFHLKKFKQTENKDIKQQTIEALTQMTLLLYRYSLTASQPAQANILEDIPQSILDYIDQPSTIIPLELIQILNKQGNAQITVDIGTNGASLKSALEPYINYFLNILNKKFSFDEGYVSNNTPLETYEMLEQILAIFIRCMKIIAQAEEYLLQTKDTDVSLRTPTGPMTINPNTTFDETVKPSVTKFQKAQNKLITATVQFKAKKIDLATYEKAKADADLAAQEVAKANLKYRTTYTLYYPVKQQDGSDKTVVEFIKQELENVKNKTSENLGIINDIYNFFQPNIGLPLSAIWKNSAATEKVL